MEPSTLLPSLRRPRSRDSRGQGLVELALVLPLLVVLLVMAIDFGRVYFGWVALHNAVRIGADYAAGHAKYWDGMKPTYEDERDRYELLIRNDLQSLNCTLGTVADPVFSGYEDGDLVHAEITCSFGLITPLAETILGGDVDMSVATDFAIYRTIVGGLPGCAAGDLKVPVLIGQAVADARDIWDATDFTGAFDPVSGSDTEVVDGQTPMGGDCAPTSSGMTVTFP